MNRSEALALWQRVANGDLARAQDDPVDLHSWIRGIAAALIEADTVHDKFRHATIVEAIGLLGKRDRGVEFFKHLQVMEEFSYLTEDGVERAPKRGERMKSLIAAARFYSQEAARETGRLDDLEDVTDPELRRRIERMFARKL